MTWLDWHDTIAAIATAQAGALRGIVRISGPKVGAILAALDAHPAGSDLTQPALAQNDAAQNEATHHDAAQRRSARRARCGSTRLQLPPPWGPVPAIVYHWPEGASYTRQEMAELHLPGAPPLITAVLQAVCRHGARLARPGEFTLRAFLAGRLDLTQAEAVLGTIEAESPAELKAALRQLAGGLAQPLTQLREELVDLLAHLEAGLDFADEEIPLLPQEFLLETLDRVACQLKRLMQQMQVRGRSDLVPRVVLLGRPNAGKSSLLNALVGDEAALVSPQAGTTRDAVTWRVRSAGRELVLSDTAGLDATPADALAHAACQATWQQVDQADLVLWCRDRSQPPAAYDQALAEALAQTEKPCLVVWTKCDLPPADASFPQASSDDAVCTSSRTGQGIAALWQAIAERLEASAAEMTVVASTAQRCRTSLAAAAAALDRARQAAQQPAEELVAAELRLALEALGEVTGSVYTEEILDRIFQRFCIGK
jgi:tRNA modification GTPase